MGNLTLYDKRFTSRFLLGTALYPSPKIMEKSLQSSKTQIVTVCLRRENAAGQDGKYFFDFIKKMNFTLLPNTAGCYSVKEAVNTAYMAREVFKTSWIKLELISNSAMLNPDPLLTIEAAKILLEDGFSVFPFINDDLAICGKLVDLGCKVLMPWASPIGSAMGVQNPYALQKIREYFPQISLIVDAGIGAPSQAASVMEMGYDAILLNTAVAKAGDPVLMAEAFAGAIIAGRKAYLGKVMPPRSAAHSSTAEFGTAFSAF